MDPIQRIRDNFNESIQTQIAAIELLAEPIAHAGELLTQCLINGHKILSCGNGGSALIASQFAAKMLGRFERERPSLPVTTLTADMATLTAVGNDYSFNEVFAKQVRALGQQGDVLFAVSTSGNSRNVIAAMEAALARDMYIVALTARDGGSVAGLLGPNDVEVRVPGNHMARIHESHLLVTHCLCDYIDRTLFGIPGE